MNNLKTRDQLIVAAKQLFIKKGYDDTTMTNIAIESGLSRRTLYTYFESKVEIYQAVINSETDYVIEKLTAIASKPLNPKLKITEFLYSRFAIVKEVVDRNGSLRSEFFRNIFGVEHFRKDFDLKERQLLQQIISEGKESGVFDVTSVWRTSEVIQYCLRGFEAPYIRGTIWRNNTCEEMRFETQKLIFGILGCSN